MSDDPRSPRNGQTPAVQVSDPDDYNRTQRFREIHTARQRVTEFLAGMEWGNGGESYYTQDARQLGTLVSLYIFELSPLIRRSALDPDKYLPEDRPVQLSLLRFASNMGAHIQGNKAHEPVSPMITMQYFDAANRFYAEIGMDLDLEEEDGDAGFEYSDLLDEGPPGSGEAPDIDAAGDD